MLHISDRWMLEGWFRRCEGTGCGHPFALSKGGKGSARGWDVGTPSHFRKVEGEHEGVGHGHPLVLSKGGGGARGGGVWAPPRTLCFRLKLNPLRRNDHLFRFLVRLERGPLFRLNPLRGSDHFFHF